MFSIFYDNVIKMAEKYDLYSHKNIVVRVFREHWARFKEFRPEHITGDIEENVEKMLGCGLLENGFFEYMCLSCLNTHKVGFTCKSRFCLRCSKVYIDRWLDRMKKSIFKWIEHRHVILTVPGSLWEYFHDPSLLDALAEVGVRTVKEVASLGSRKAEIEIGIIEVIQTAGRASTWNPHLHLLVTEGRLDKEGSWHNGIYLEYETLKKKWMYNLLNMLKERMASRKDVLEKIEEVYQKRKDKGFIVRAKKERIRKKDIVGYLIKYVASPPIALSRIEEYDGEKVIYWYREHPTDKKVWVTVSAFEFIRRMIQHIMPKQFRMIRHSGLYARNKVGKVRKILTSFFENIKEMTREFEQMAKRVASLKWRERIKKSFGKDPLICPKCGDEMILYKIWHPRHGVIYHYLDHLLEDELIKDEKEQEKTAAIGQLSFSF